MNEAQIIENYWQTGTAVQQAAARAGAMTVTDKLAWQDVLRRQLDSVRHLKILDVNTRTGAMAMLMAHMRHTVTGIDQSDGLLAVATQRAAEAKLNCRFIRSAPDSVVFPDATFDVVTVLTALHEISDPKKALTAWARVLKPGGRLLIIADDPTDRAALRRYRAAQRTPGTDTYWHTAQKLPLWEAPADALSGLLQYTGWENVAVSKLGGQLTRTGIWRQRRYAVGHIVISAAKGGRIPLTTIA